MKDTGPDQFGRSMPHDLIAEECVLDALLWGGPEAMDAVADTLTRHDFYREGNALIFDAMRNIALRNHTVDGVTVRAEMQRLKTLDLVGGFERISEMGNTAPDIANVEAYAAIVKDKSSKRAIILASSKAVALAFQDELSGDEISASATSDLADAVGNSAKSRYGSPVKECLKRAFEGLLNRVISGETIIGASTGFSRLDKLLCGLRPGEITVIAGRPSMGKSTLVKCIATNAALAGEKIYYASLEDTETMLMNRILSAESMIPLTSINTGRTAMIGASGPMRDHETAQIGDVLDKMFSAPIIIDDNRGVTPSSLRARARRAKTALGGLSLIVVDHIGLMHADPSPTRRGMSRNDEVTEIVNALQSMARETGSHAILLCQLNRDVERREDKRPTLADLRDSGSIEQAADNVAFIYRPVYYASKQEGKPINTEEMEEVEVIIAKQRNGPTAMCKLAYFPWVTKFGNLSEGGF